MHKVLFIATYGDFFSSFQINNMKIWIDLGCEVHCVANFNEPRYNRFTNKIDNIGVIRHNIDFCRTPFTIKTFSFYKQLKDLMKSENVTIIDTHNPIVSVLSRLAAKSCYINKVVYTVHGFFFFKGCSLTKRLLYKPVEYIMARYTDVFIVTNLEDFDAAKKMKVRGKAYYIPGVGVDLDSIRNLNVNKTLKRKELGIPADAFVLLSVGECIKRKNHESAIRAFAQADIPNSYYIVVGDGELLEYLRALAHELSVGDKVIFPGYRSDANEILKIADLYVFPSFQEGLSVALMQAMVAGLPIVASDIRGNTDCVIDGKGGNLFKSDDIKKIKINIEKMYYELETLKKYGDYNYKRVEKFSKEVVEEKNKKIFASILEE